MAWRSSLSKHLQELRVIISQTSPGSAGAREFVLGNYAELKKANPSFPILIREATTAEAKLVARYDFGEEKSVSVENLDVNGISSKLQELIKMGETMPSINIKKPSKEAASDFGCFYDTSANSTTLEETKTH